MCTWNGQSLPLLRRRWRHLTRHLLLQRLLGESALCCVLLVTLGQYMIEPELCTLHVLCEVGSLSADAITLGVALFLGVVDSLVEVA
jgi:hypothetical protein